MDEKDPRKNAESDEFLGYGTVAEKQKSANDNTEVTQKKDDLSKPYGTQPNDNITLEAW
mgnify:CR=1 FL=1